MEKLKLLEDIYRQYSSRMLLICMRYCGDKSLARDLMHDGFIKIYDSLGKFEDRGEGSIRAWMDKVMVNHCLQYLRKKDIFKESKELDYLPNEEIVTEDDNILAERTKEIPDDVLHGFIMELPDGYRAVFNMYVIDGLSHKEISKALSINEKSSSSQLSRAKGLLVKKIKEYESKRK
jgi:RNA polymerase sigma-70 factor, ECF subfamily